MRYNQITSTDINNGPGVRVSIFTQGCPIQCPSCFNKELWNEEEGQEWNNATLELVLALLSRDYIDGITWLGGEPTIWASAIMDINRIIRNTYPNKTIWLYSGRTLKQLLARTETRDLLHTVDVLVDGPFIESLKDPSLKFRGSSNQKIWNIKRSLELKDWIEYETTNLCKEK